MSSEDLEKRVGVLEVKMGAAIAIAVVLGLGGAGLGGLLLYSYQRISELSQKVDTADQKLISATTKAENDIKDTAVNYLADFNAKLRTIRIDADGSIHPVVAQPDGEARYQLNTLSCPPGEVLVELRFKLGGGCNDDGRPIAKQGISGICQRLALTASQPK